MDRGVTFVTSRPYGTRPRAASSASGVGGEDLPLRPQRRWCEANHGVVYTAVEQCKGEPARAGQVEDLVTRCGCSAGRRGVG